MARRSRNVRSLATAICACLAIVGCNSAPPTPTPSQAPATPTPTPIGQIGQIDPVASLAQLETAQVDALQRLRTASTTPVTISYDRGRPISVLMRVPATGNDALSRATAFVADYGGLYLQAGTDWVLHPRHASPDPALPDLTSVQFLQLYKDVPAVHASFQVMVRGTEVVGTSGALIPAVPVMTDPTIDAATAESVAFADFPGTRRMGVTRLVIDASEGEAAPAPRLLWRVRNGPLNGHETLVDAHDARIVSRTALDKDHDPNFDLEMFDGAGNSADWDCYLADIDFGASSYIGSEGGLIDGWREELDASNGFWYGRLAYELWHGNYNRHGYDGSDGQLEIFVHSSWDGDGGARWHNFCELMEFRLGSVQNDVVVHEYTHGVIDNNSYLPDGLKSGGQSGALNEAYSDLHGILADTYDWQLAEDRPGGPVRDLGSPFAPDVAHMSQLYTGPADNGGVHWNATIPGNAHYLMTVGGTNQVSNVAVKSLTIGGDEARVKMSKIAYGAMFALSYDATFVEARDLEVFYAEAYMQNGSFGFNAADVCTVRLAWFAVGVGNRDTDCDGLEDQLDDSDGDGITDDVDNCAQPNPSQADSDGDGQGNKCDSDDDNDNFPDATDLCPSVADAQGDQDGDGIGDACDSDSDNDWVPDASDKCPFDPDSLQKDTDGDGFGNACDNDMDNDGLPNTTDNCPALAGATGDADGDTYEDSCDPCPTDADPGSHGFSIYGTPIEADADSDGIPEECDSPSVDVDPGAKFTYDLAKGGPGACPPECQYEVAPEQLLPEWTTTVTLGNIDGALGVWITDELGSLMDKSTCTSSPSSALEVPPAPAGFDTGSLVTVGFETAGIRSCSGSAPVTLDFHSLPGTSYLLNVGLPSDAPASIPVNLTWEVTSGARTLGDRDGDGVADEEDTCDSVANPTQADSDGDGVGDACDPIQGPPATGAPSPSAGISPSPSLEPTPSPTPTPTPTPPPTASPTPAPTPTPGPTPVDGGPTVGDVDASETEVFWQNSLDCFPDSIFFSVTVTDPDGVSRVRLEHRFVSRDSGTPTRFFETAMTTRNGSLWFAEVEMDLGDDATEDLFDPADIDVRVVAFDTFGGRTRGDLHEAIADVIVCKP